MPLPVEAILPKLHSALEGNQPVVLQAPPGSGKTVLVAPSLIDSPWLKGRKILLLEPRRLATRMAANYMAQCRNESVGQTIGYQVRLERRISQKTKVEVITEGILTRKLLADPELKDVGCVIFDEFHERSIHTDVGLALIHDVRSAFRDDLRLVVMSATLDTETLTSHLGKDCCLINCDVPTFPVSTTYLAHPSKLPTWQSAAEAILRALEQESGSILVFLPGEGEIRRCEEYLLNRQLDPSILIAPLYAKLEKNQQEEAVRPAPIGYRKVVLATSIAESSVTIEGIRVVIDTGRVRVPRFSPTTGLPRLTTVPISLDRADQRRGRAGRLEPGICWRLWDKQTHAQLPAHAQPEILQTDLSTTVLQTACWGDAKLQSLNWLTPPPSQGWNVAVTLLRELDALTDELQLTEHGRKLLSYPLHPRLANLILRSEAYGWGESACHLAAELTGEPSLANHLIAHLTNRNSQRNPAPSALLLAIGFPDRIAKRREGNRFLMLNGSGAVTAHDELPLSDWLIIKTLQDTGQPDLLIRDAEPFNPEWMSDYFSHLLSTKETTYWDKKREAVQSVKRSCFGAIILNETPLTKGGDVLSAQLEGLRQKGISNLEWSKAALALRARLQFLHEQLMTDAWSNLSDEALLQDAAEWLPLIAPKALQWEQLRRIDLHQVLTAFYLKGRRAELDRLAPTDFPLPSGARCKIHYDGPQPHAELRIQEAFGLKQTPRLVDGKVPIVMHLLSPARRPVQVTTDLKSFWDQGYAITRKELRGRYPKHYWPEDPYQAEPLRGNRVRPPSVKP